MCTQTRRAQVRASARSGLFRPSETSFGIYSGKGLATWPHPSSKSFSMRFVTPNRVRLWWSGSVSKHSVVSTSADAARSNAHRIRIPGSPKRKGSRVPYLGFLKHRCCVLGLFLRHHLRCIIKWIFPQFLRMQICTCVNTRAQRRVTTEASSCRHRRRW
jgi:hypothetical protein